MSIFFDPNTIYSSIGYNAKLGFLFSTGVLKHIPLDSLNSYIKSLPACKTGEITITTSTSIGAVVLNGMVIILDSSVPILTGYVPSGTPVSLGITQISNKPYFALYPAGVLPKNYVKVATFIPALSEWVYEPVIGKTSDLIFNSFGSKISSHSLDSVISGSITSIPLFGNEGYIYSDFSQIQDLKSIDQFSGISASSSYPIVDVTGSMYDFTTQLVLDPFTKSFIHVPVSVNRGAQYQQITGPYPTGTGQIDSFGYVNCAPIGGPIVTISGTNYESFIFVHSNSGTSYGNTLFISYGYFNGSSFNIFYSGVSSTCAVTYPQTYPLAIPSLDKSGHKFFYKKTTTSIGGFNMLMTTSGTLQVTSLPDLPAPTSNISSTVNAVPLGTMTFVMGLDYTIGRGVIYTLLGTSTSNLWPSVTFNNSLLVGSGYDSAPKLLVDCNAIAHIVFASGTSLFSYDLPLGIPNNTGTIRYLTNLTLRNISVAQNIFGDSIIVIYNNPYFYYSLNFGPFIKFGPSMPNIQETGYSARVVAANSYFLVFIDQYGTTLIGLDGYAHFIFGGGAWMQPGFATLSPIIFQEGVFNIFSLPRMIVPYPSVFQYHWNPNYYPSGTSEILYSDNNILESRITNAISVNGNLRPQQIQVSSILKILGDDGAWWRVHPVSGTFYSGDTFVSRGV